jgi:hypothetical protein
MTPPPADRATLLRRRTTVGHRSGWPVDVWGSLPALDFRRRMTAVACQDTGTISADGHRLWSRLWRQHISRLSPAVTGEDCRPLALLIGPLAGRWPLGMAHLLPHRCGCPCHTNREGPYDLHHPVARLGAASDCRKISVFDFQRTEGPAGWPLPVRYL